MLIKVERERNAGLRAVYMIQGLKDDSNLDVKTVVNSVLHEILRKNGVSFSTHAITFVLSHPSLERGSKKLSFDENETVSDFAVTMLQSDKSASSIEGMYFELYATPRIVRRLL